MTRNNLSFPKKLTFNIDPKYSKSKFKTSERLIEEIRTAAIRFQVNDKCKIGHIEISDDLPLPDDFEINTPIKMFGGEFIPTIPVFKTRQLNHLLKQFGYPDFKIKRFGTPLPANKIRLMPSKPFLN